MRTAWKSLRIAMLSGAVLAAVLPGSARANWGGWVGGTWQHFIHSTAPAINKGWIHFTKQLPTIDPSMNAPPGSVPVTNPQPCPLANVPIQITSESGPSITVIYKNITAFSETITVYDQVGKAWIYHGVIGPSQKAYLSLRTGDGGYGEVGIRVDTACSLVSYDWLSQGETID